MPFELLNYDTAKQALDKAERIDEVKHIRDQGEAMRAYARQAGDYDMEAKAIAIRMRASRRIDEIRRAQKATVGLARGGAEKGVGRRGKNAGRAATRITLAEVGINKHLANEARKLGALSEPAFESAVRVAQDK